MGELSLGRSKGGRPRPPKPLIEIKVPIPSTNISELGLLDAEGGPLSDSDCRLIIQQRLYIST